MELKAEEPKSKNMADQKLPDLGNLGKKQIQSVDLDISDNGVLTVNWSTYTPAKTYSEDQYKNYKEVFEDCAKATDRLVELNLAKIKSHPKFKKLTIECE